VRKRPEAASAFRFAPRVGRVRQAAGRPFHAASGGRDRSAASRRQAIGPSLISGRLSQDLPAATMQLTPVGVVLTTVQVRLSEEA